MAKRIWLRWLTAIVAVLMCTGISVAFSSGAKAAPHKVMVIIDENHNRTQAEASMPYITGLGNQYGHATGYNAITHPSLPNYLAIWGGSTFGVTSDCSVGSSGCVPTAPSVWGQDLAVGVTAKAYQESMTSNCQTGGSGSYAPRHGPWPYWTNATERGYCNANDVPMGTTTSGNLLNDINSGNLPVTGEMTPNLCNDAHDTCTGTPLTTADNWLKGWIPKLMAGPDYQAGNLTIIVTFDEGDSSSNNVLFVVIDPRLNAKTVTGSFNHYALTKWLDDNSGVSDLRSAATAGDLRAAFGLGGGTVQQPPTVTTGTASNVTATSATVSGTVNPNGADATCSFDYGQTTGYGGHTATVDAGAGTSAVTVTGTPSGLAAGTLYHYRLVCTNSGGTTNGADATFTTASATQNPPSVTTGAASGMTSSSATLNGSVNPNGAATTCHFEYGTTTAYGSVTPNDTSPGAGTTAVAVTSSVTGLAPSTTYHNRLVCSNSGGTSNGSDTTFATAASGGTGSVTLTPVADSYVSSGQSATNYGTVTPLSVSASSFRALLKFNTNGAVPAGSTVTGATLSLYNTNAPATTGGYEFHPEADTWTETGVTWANQPTWNTSVLATSATPAANARITTTIPVSALNMTGNTDFGARYTTASVIEKPSSREDAANPPKLTITYTTPNSTAFPVRAAFYYPWYPESWTNPAPHYTPTLGAPYNSSDPSVIASHIASMQYAHLNAGIASWWGQGTQTDSRVPALESGAAGTGFKWALYYEPEGQGDPTVAQLQSDLNYILGHYASDPSYLHINGKPVIFSFADGADGCGMADRWAQADTMGFYDVLKVFPGFATCASQPSNWHQYGPAVAADEQTGHSYTVSPGFFKYDEATPRLARDTSRFTANVQAMVASGEPFQLVTSFNEWGEGTSVESANEWASASGNGSYLDILHNNIPS